MFRATIRTCYCKGKIAYTWTRKRVCLSYQVSPDLTRHSCHHQRSSATSSGMWCICRTITSYTTGQSGSDSRCYLLTTAILIIHWCCQHDDRCRLIIIGVMWRVRLRLSVTWYLMYIVKLGNKYTYAQHIVVWPTRIVFHDWWNWVVWCAAQQQSHDNGV